MKHLLWIAVVLLGCAAGCSKGEAHVSADKDQDIRNNMTRTLSDEEIGKMGGGPPSGPAKGTDKKPVNTK